MLRNLVRSLLALVLSMFSFAALAHDAWINRGAYRNPAGEWCCGAEDCGVVAPGAVKAGTGGYSLRGNVTYGEAVTGNAADGPTHQEPVNEVVPYSAVAAFARRCLLALQAAGRHAALLLRTTAGKLNVRLILWIGAGAHDQRHHDCCSNQNEGCADAVAAAEIDNRCD